jgi:MSHA biogenesis protein MshP
MIFFNQFLSTKRRLQHGFALVSAIFLLVVLAGLGVAMMTFTTAQHASSGMDVMGARAYQAARAGIEWALFQRLNPPVSGGTPTYCALLAGNLPYNLIMPAGTTLTPFTVTLTCNVTYDSAPTGGITVRTITATACNQPSNGACPNSSPTSPNYVQRTIQVTLQNKGQS